MNDGFEPRLNYREGMWRAVREPYLATVAMLKPDVVLVGFTEPSPFAIEFRLCTQVVKT